jgi:hypothetical protein
VLSRPSYLVKGQLMSFGGWETQDTGGTAIACPRPFPTLGAQPRVASRRPAGLD